MKATGKRALMSVRIDQCIRDYYQVVSKQTKMSINDLHALTLIAFVISGDVRQICQSLSDSPVLTTDFHLDCAPDMPDELMDKFRRADEQVKYEQQRVHQAVQELQRVAAEYNTYLDQFGGREEG